MTEFDKGELALILVLVVSLVEAFFILPAHLGHAMHHYDPNNAGRLRRYFERFIDWTGERLVGRSVEALLRWRYLWIGTVIGLFLVSLGLSGVVRGSRPQKRRCGSSRHTGGIVQNQERPRNKH